jgi:hypothetical protein
LAADQAVISSVQEVERRLSMLPLSSPDLNLRITAKGKITGY